MGIGSTDFQIEIVRQGWLGPTQGSDYDPVSQDLNTHGDIRLVIGGTIVASGDGQGDYGISEAALGLLRTLSSDWPEAGDKAFAERLIGHGCGGILMMSCPIGIDWTVRHHDGRVRIGDVVRHDGVGEAEVELFPGLAVELPLADYRDEIVGFAKRAKEPFDGIEKSIADEYDRQEYANFWEEYDRLLDQAVTDSVE